MAAALLLHCWITLCVFCALRVPSCSASPALHGSDHEAAEQEARSGPLVFLELCVMKEDAGPCKAVKERFFFDVDVGHCSAFEYGGCGGNTNNFHTMEACRETCVVSADKSPCHLEEAPGPCRGLVTRYFFDSVAQECREFYYGGCFGNANNFKRMAECQSRCQKPAKTTKEPGTEVGGPQPTNASEIKPPIKTKEVDIPLHPVSETNAVKTAINQQHAAADASVPQNRFKAPGFCLLPREEGPCQASERRFSFDPQTQKCGPFHYGGCGGNRNKFVNRRQCMKICMNVRPPKSRMIRIRRRNMDIVLGAA